MSIWTSVVKIWLVYNCEFNANLLTFGASYLMANIWEKAKINNGWNFEITLSFYYCSDIQYPRRVYREVTDKTSVWGCLLINKSKLGCSSAASALINWFDFFLRALPKWPSTIWYENPLFNFLANIHDAEFLSF